MPRPGRRSSKNHLEEYFSKAISYARDLPDALLEKLDRSIRILGKTMGSRMLKTSVNLRQLLGSCFIRLASNAILRAKLKIEVADNRCTHFHYQPSTRSTSAPKKPVRL
jgi:hypothetical protein